MTENLSSTSINIRSELVDVAVEFLKSPKIINEKMIRKRDFLKKKGLTDTEINYAFQLLTEQDDTLKPNEQSTLLQKVLTSLSYAGCIVFAIKIFNRWFYSNEYDQENQLNKTVKDLITLVGDIQKGIDRLERAAEQLNFVVQVSNKSQTSSIIENIQKDIQEFKQFITNNSQSPSNMSYEKSKMFDSDNDDIIVISHQNKNNLNIK